MENTFNKNSGTKGPIYLEFQERTGNKAVFIAGNTFTQNAGYIDNNVIFIRARGTNVYSAVPQSDGTMFCHGYNFLHNTFKNNIGCSG